MKAKAGDIISWINGMGEERIEKVWTKDEQLVVSSETGEIPIESIRDYFVWPELNSLE